MIIVKATLREKCTASTLTNALKSRWNANFVNKQSYYKINNLTKPPAHKNYLIVSSKTVNK